MPKFIQGDIVRLKSGSPKMTINSIEWTITKFSDKPTEPYAAKCVWFEGEKVQHGTYSLEAIELWKDID